MIPLASSTCASEEAELLGPEVLGLDSGEADPVLIILAAQLRLRECRRRLPAGADGQAWGEVRRIVAARDALLRRAISGLTNRVRARGST